jgi:hypothetical protein
MISTKTEPAMNGRTLRDTGATLPTLGGMAAAFGVASCCGLPFLVATVGVGSAWLTGIYDWMREPQPEGIFRPLRIGKEKLIAAA